MPLQTTPAWKAIVLLLVPAIPALAAPASPTKVAPCDSDTARELMIRTLPKAAEDRPVDITFRTRAKGVNVPDYLLARFPDEMPVVLQYQFERLVVTSDRFEVTLWFKGRPERLVVPFNAVTAFFDDEIAKCAG